MKKTLSVLLSLLMVVSCMTCLFTMPASAVEATSTESEAVENLPDNLLVAVEGSEGRKYSFSKDLVSKEFYQLDVVVTADATATAKTFYPTLLDSAGTSKKYYSIVGVRYSAADPTNVETAYNLIGNCLVAKGTAANNVAGTYTYTYIVSPTTGAKGISFPGDVTIESANMFALKDTQWNDFFWEPNKVFRYMVKEGNNVFQRMYGYRDIGAAALTGNGASVGANIDGKLYNLELKAGQTYAVDYDIRIAANTANAKKFPGMDMFDTEMFDVRKEYKALRDRLVEADQFPEDEAGKILGIDEYRYVAGGIPGTGDFLNTKYIWATATATPPGIYTVSEDGHIKVDQVIYDGNRNGYSNSKWIATGIGNTTLVHRANTEEIAKLNVYTSTGSNQGGLTSTSSQVGGNYWWINRDYNSQWLDATYTLTAPEYKTLDEQYVLITKKTGDGGKDNYYLNATAEEVDGKTVYTYTKGHNDGARIIPHGEVGHAGVAIYNILAGAVYDFDNFKVSTVDNTLTAPAVKGKDSNGNLNKGIHANDDTTKVTVDTNVDLVADTFTATFDYDATREAYGEFVGWYNGDTLISTEKTAALPYSAYKADPTSVYAVVEYENYMGNVGGFESYTKNNTNLMPELETITFSDSSTRQQYAKGPTGEYWGQWENRPNFRLPTGIPYDASVAEFITEHGANFASATKGVIAKIGDVSFNNPKTGNVKRTAKPYKGNNMGYMNEATFIAIKAIEGLTPGKTYMLSFYTTTLNATGEGIEAAAVTNTPLDFNCYTKGVAGGDNRPANKILGYAYTQGTHSGTDDDDYGIWDRIVLYFTASDDTEYFWMRTPNSQTFVDEFVCKEFNEINVAYDTNWDFEDGKAISDGLNNMSRYDVGVKSTYQVVDNDTDLDKLGSKYLKLTSVHKSYNAVNINFNYNSTDKYVISFDMKVMKYATGANNKIEMFASKLNNMGYYQTDHLATNALAAKDGYTLTRAYEDGKYFQLVEDPTSAGQFMFTTLSTTNDAGVSVYGENYGGAAWDEWTHYEIEIDPSQSSYSGPATFGILPQGIGWEIGFDNFKVEKFSADVIAEFGAKFAPTYAYNIRSASSGFKQGLRFKSSIDLGALGLISADDEIDSNKDAITGTFSNGTKIVEYGTIASTKSAYENISATNKFQFRQMAKDVVKDASKSYVIPGVAYNAETGKDIRYSYENGVVTYTGVLVGIDTANIATDFVVRAYVILEDAKGMRTVVYGDVQTLNMYQAADYVVHNSTVQGDIDAAQEVIDAYNAANKQ